MPNLQQVAMTMINMRKQRDPGFAQDPNSQAMIQAIQSGNQQDGEAIANQILNKFGMSREQGVQQATQGLQQMLHGLGLRM